MKFDIVIAGGGFAGAYCARALGRALGRVEGEKRVALVAERNVLVFQPMLAEVAGATLSPVDVVNPLRHFCRGVVVLQGSVHSIDWPGRTLALDGGRFSRNHPVQFDHLVLALGSVTDLSKVPGMAEYGWPMKNVADALRLRSALINRMEEANLVEDPLVQARLLTFVVVGGGYTGVETAGQVLDLVNEASGYYVNLRVLKPRVILVHSREELLGEIGPELGGYAKEVLVERGVELRLGARVTEVTATRVVLNDGTSIEANTVVSTIGNAPNPVVLDLCRQLGLEAEHGRIPTGADMRVRGETHLWAVGDCAAVPWNDRGTVKTSPPTAQFAFRQGAQVGRNLARRLRGKPIRDFHYRYLGQLATIGDRQAVAEILGFHFRGFIAWWLWRTIYLAKLPGLSRKLRVMIDWTFDLFFPRDISVMMPPPEDLLRAIHLEKGELLFEADSALKAFYYVRRGSLIYTAPGQPERVLPAGTVIDRDFAGAEGRWPGRAVAAESADVSVFRGRLLQLLDEDLKIGRR